MASADVLRKMLDSAAARKGLPGAGSALMRSVEERGKTRTDAEQALREAQDLVVAAIEQFEERAQAQEEKHEAEMMDALAKHEAEEQASEKLHAEEVKAVNARCAAAEARLLVEVEARAKAEGALAGVQEACRVAEAACEAERAAHTESKQTFSTLMQSDGSVIENDFEAVDVTPVREKGMVTHYKVRKAG